MTNNLLKWFNELISNTSSKSSARLLNIFGGALFGVIFIADFITNKHINQNALNTLSLYYGGVFTLSKLLDKQGDTKDSSSNQR
jgi:lipid-A-disaccharide synthase-like uncharacterized protein